MRDAGCDPEVDSVEAMLLTAAFLTIAARTKDETRAVAEDGLAPQALARLSEGTRVPATSVLVEGGLACAFALTGSFDQLTDAVVFASWLFYGLNGFGRPRGG